MNRALIGWFDAHHRNLAFRRTRDPYAVLVAEVMLQQTQVGRVEPIWGAFMRRFPTIAALASASPADVIRTWGGLGYYGRAVRLQHAAEAIVERHAGRVPDDIAALQALPGIGPYTARAVAAIAFGRPVAAVDTNIGRVVRRVCGLDGTADSPAVGSQAADPPVVVQRLADGMVAPTWSGDWTHAMMDVGASLCRRRDPLCAECPLRLFCLSAARWGRAGFAAGEARSATPIGPPGRTRAPRPTTPFPTTRRWLRGRLVARLRDESDGRWVRFDGPIGEHLPGAVEDALSQLAAEGLVERDPVGRARLPQSRARSPKSRETLPRGAGCVA